MRHLGKILAVVIGLTIILVFGIRFITKAGEKRKALKRSSNGKLPEDAYDETEKVAEYVQDYDINDNELGLPPSDYSFMTDKFKTEGPGNNLLYSIDGGHHKENYRFPTDTQLLPVSVDYDVYMKDKSCLIDKGRSKDKVDYGKWIHVGTVYPIDMRLQNDIDMMPLYRRGIGEGEYEYKIVRGDRMYIIQGVIRDKYRIPRVPGLEGLGDLYADFLPNYQYDWTLE